MSIPAEDALSAAAQTPATRASGEESIAVELDGVTKRFGKIAALDDVSLLVRRGELMTLLGPSGCGKTTLLNLVGGFLMPDSGEIAIDGQRVTDVSAYRREIGITFQNYALFPHMNVAANVGYGLRMRRVAKAEIARRVADALALIKLAGLEDRKPRQLSGGQQQRVALARALVIRPKVLLLDEPFSALDRNLRASMQVELKEIQRKLGVTTIFVTHDQSEALSLSDRIAVMAEGRIRQLGSPDEIYRRPVDRFVASFVGDVNVLRARLERIDGAIATVALGAARVRVPSRTLQGAATGCIVDLFVRPEELRPTEPGMAVAADGIVAAQSYQGGHVDLYLGAPAALSGRVLLRVPRHEGMSRWRAGAPIGIALAADEAIAFRPA
ncbi:MAG: ABC transporter ATP-binding protein [Hyphomicrobiales bacterium]|nr:ABC transporter ATP-binding protein [Hyphomicrobiales bacterium]